MSEPYLIAHKVSGQPAFDIAEWMECPECGGEYISYGCTECDKGVWWIIPTSGHRAYPFWNAELPAMMEDHPDVGLEIRWGHLFPEAEYTRVGKLPPNFPDHYATSASPTQVRASLESLLAALPPALSKPFKRRF